MNALFRAMGEILFVLLVGTILGFLIKKNFVKSLSELRNKNLRDCGNYLVIAGTVLVVYAVCKVFGVFDFIFEVLLDVIG